MAFNDLNRWAMLGLMASDASYRDRFAQGDPLATYPDSGQEADLLSPEVLARFGLLGEANGTTTRVAGDLDANGAVIATDWKFVERIPGVLGFSAVIFRDNLSQRAIIAFTGTTEYVDWWVNLRLGTEQWDRNKHLVVDALDRLKDGQGRDFVGEVLFTGQSLGGALAQYALEEFELQNESRFRDLNPKLITFNSLGGVDGRKILWPGRTLVDLDVQNVPTAHFTITNDLVSRLGGGFLNTGSNTLNFDFRSSVAVGTPTGLVEKTPALSLMDAHRIESGFYRGFQKYGQTFLDATPNTVEQIDVESFRERGPAFAGLMTRERMTEDEALARTAAAALVLVSTSPLMDGVMTLHSVMEHFRAASTEPDAAKWLAIEAAAQQAILNPVVRPTFNSAATALTLLAITMPRGPDEIAAFHASLASENYPAGTMDDGMLVALRGSSNVEEIEAKAATVLKLVGGDWSPAMDAVLSHACEPAQLAATMTGSDWQGKLFESVTEQAAAHGLDIGKSLAELVVGVETYAAPVVAEAGEPALDGFRERIRDALAQTWKGIANAFGELTRKHADTPVAIDHAFSAQAMRTAATNFGQAIAEWNESDGSSFADDLRAASQELRLALDDAARGLRQAAQQIVIREGRETNPFDDEAFAGDAAVASATLAEGAVRTFTLFLPFKVEGADQRVALQLSGSAAPKFNVLRFADAIPVDANGRFELIVPVGAREVSFGLHANQDVDLDATLSLSAQLIDADGTPTHVAHAEVSIAFDAAVEPTGNPTSVRAGTLADDNRSGDGTHQPLWGTAGADRLQGLAGRDELYAGGGNDLIESGSGNDLASGEGGDDRIFADTVMDDAALRAFIASSAAMVDNTDAPAVHGIQNGEWLIGALGDDTVVGGATPDVLFGGGGRDLIVGGAGHDIIDGDDEYEPGTRDQVDALTTIAVTRRWGGHPHEIYYSSVTPTHIAREVGGDDVIHAGSGDDIVTAQYGNDTVHGDQGDDTIAGDAGDDALFGGTGNDRISGDWFGTNDTLEPHGDDYLDGGDGNDILSGEAGADVLVGGAGNDQLRGFIGVTFAGVPNEAPADDQGDHLSGGDGDDELIGDGASDTLVGGAGHDQLFGDSDQTPVALHGDDHLDGGAGNDYLRGYGGNDELHGGAGIDTLHGEVGQDILDGGENDDVLFGMDGDDRLAGGWGLDELVGGAGADWLDGGGDEDFLWGEAGDDVIHSGGGRYYIEGGDGSDTIHADSGTGIAYGGAGTDNLYGGAAIDQLAGGTGADRIEAGDGDDHAWGEADDDHIAGEGGNDVLVGGAGDDVLDGGAGEDALHGEAGNDTLIGGAGRDQLLGGAGNDVYRIGRNDGEDIILDQEGSNRIVFEHGIRADDVVFRRGVDFAGDDGHLVVEIASSGAQVAILQGMSGGVEQFVFADGTSLTRAEALARLTANTASSPPLVSAPATRITYGGTGADQLVGLASDDIVYARDGDDELIGGAGRDRLEGGTGADRLDGGPDKDVLIGGEGTDTYVFDRTSGGDVVEESYLPPQPGGAEIDTVSLATGIVPGEVTLHRDGHDLVIAVAQTAAQLRIRSHFLATETIVNRATNLPEQVPADHGIERLQFADGVVWDAAAIESRIVAGWPNGMTGTAGNDTFTVDHIDDTVSEAAAAGDDTIRSAISFALRPNVERLVLTGFVGTSAWAMPGNAISHLTGNAGDNTFNAPGEHFAASGERVQASTGGTMGYAVMSGGAGHDTYYLNAGIGGQVIESSGQGRDTVVLTGSWVDYTLPEHVEELRSEEGAALQTETRTRTGNALDNYLEGWKATSPLPGQPANLIDGRGGADTMVGFNGNDVFIVEHAGDRVIDHGVFADGGEHSTADEVRSSIGYELPDHIEILRLTGSAAIDGFGNALPNTLDGSGNGAVNRLHGGMGSDHYVVDPQDIVVERVGEGIDSVEFRGMGTRTYTSADLPGHVEALVLADDAWGSGYAGDARAERVTGNSSANLLVGAGGNDTLVGGGGNDTIEGGTGDDMLVGGHGLDDYRFSRGFGRDILTDSDYVVQFDSSIAPDDITFENGDLVIASSGDRIDLANAGTMRFADGTVWSQHEVMVRREATSPSAPTAGADALLGTAAADTLDALGGDDFVYGYAGDDVLAGGTGADTIRAGPGRDAVQGGDGNDQLYGDGDDDTIAGGVGDDQIDGGAGNDVIDGGAGNDSLLGGDGDDAIAGGAGTFDYAVGGAGHDRIDMSLGSGSTAAGGDGNDVLIGGTAYDDLRGGEGDDELRGGAGDDYLHGEGGIDTYWLDAGGGMDAVNEAYVAGEKTIVAVGAGLSVADLTIRSVVDEYSYLPTLHLVTRDGVDGLHLVDFDVADPQRDLEIRFADGTVWLPDEVRNRAARVDGTPGDDMMTGTASADVLYGLAGDDTLDGLDGDDVLDGGTGADAMQGGPGDDRYAVDDTGDSVVELSGEGFDSVDAALSYVLPADVEQLTLLGTARDGTGNALANVIAGNALANRIDGAAGADTMIGGAGDDTYIVGTSLDHVVEYAGEGHDGVQASVSWTLTDHVEWLTLTGSAATNATGNALANTLTGNSGANTLDGRDGADTLIGGSGNDTYVVTSGDTIVENASAGTDTVRASSTWTLGANLEHLTLLGTAAIDGTGNAAANTITGNAAANRLDGGAGSDTLKGGAGNDTYVVDAVGDVVTELSGQGTDVVRASVSFTLGSYVEQLALTGTGSINATGNTAANTLTGNAAANTLDGKTGADTMAGGAGNDTYVVDSTGDMVTELASEGDDTIRSSVTRTLAANVENLVMLGTAAINGTGNTLDNWLTGNAAANVLTASDGQDLVFGDAGNDNLLGGNGRDLLQGGDGADNLDGGAGNNLLHGGAGGDTLVGGTSHDLLIGGSGNDTLTTGSGADTIAFNRGDGQDTVLASAGTDNTLSLGGGIRHADIALRRAGNDLVVETGTSEAVTLKDWYLATTNRHVVNLQTIVDATGDWNPAGVDPLVNRRVARFDFAALVSSFDAALAANPALTRWQVADALATAHVGGSDTAAFGGDLAYQYGHANSLAGIGAAEADTVLASASFGTSTQAFQALSTLFSGTKLLR